MDLLIKNIGVLATPQGTTAKKGAEQRDICLVEQAMIGIKDGMIAYVGEENTSLRAASVLDCQGRLVTPGLVDCHTHLVFGGWRQKELALKLEDASYLDILKAGGGILSTVEHTRAATEQELLSKGKHLLDDMLLHGTTTVEVKSGYGLNLDTEMKQLRVANALNKAHAVDVVATFLGAHAFPKEFSEQHAAYVDLVCDEMLPAVKASGLAEFCDVFCETAVFTPEQSMRVLHKAAALGLKCKAHVDEIDPIAGAEMAAACSCITAEHLIQASDAGIAAMAEKDVIAALLPATSFYLEKSFARARTMIEHGVAVAIATDFNPGSSPSFNLQFPMNLACLRYRLTPAEALTAVTLNGAAAVDRANQVGSLEVGKKADVVVWDVPDLESIFYRYGSNLVHTVVKNGNAYAVSC